ncbi:S8 family peptidase [Gimesia aquarii]|uniref:Subtilase family protein n=1 Tax=Gimesia aquarii TaxID=2527964 RepID=A0A517WWN6_9PLAN|nr:S8 family peptidase [Gimesia aquarii]QDU09648.1 Subtilase family protein [Gimesia aquarii]
MPNGHNFQHLPLLRRESGPAQLGRPPRESQKTRDNKSDRTSHSGNLFGSAFSVSNTRKSVETDRVAKSFPDLQAGLALLLQIDTSLDVDKLRRLFDFEIVAEEEDGYVIVASEDIDLVKFNKAVAGFAGSVHGTGIVASIHRLDEDPDQNLRLQLILSETLYELWPNIDETAVYQVDIGVTCLGIKQIPDEPQKRKRESDVEFARRQSEWSNNRIEVYDSWYDLQDERTQEVSRIIVNGYGGSIDSIQHDEPAISLPDSFTMRIQVNGKGLKDFVFNYPYLFEVVEPDNISLTRSKAEPGEEVEPNQITAPPTGAPAVCIIDSGIQEEHVLLEPSIDKESSHCFLPPPESPTDVADHVWPAGHGTRVAGAVQYGEQVKRDGPYQLPFWIQNARILDAEASLPYSLMPAAVIRAVIERYHYGPRQTRIFNHSINADCHCRLRHMSAWAAEIDMLCHQFDIMIVQTAGNLRERAHVPSAGILDHLDAGRLYPYYLVERSSRVANPGQSFQALTVGSVAYQMYESSGWKSFATQPGHPSSFSRSGFGIWNVIKPEVVEFGGDDLQSPGSQTLLGNPSEGRACYPELVRSTMHPPGPAYDRDEVGTSFAAPKVTHIAAHLQRVLPNEPCLLYKTLIVQSARWPEWTNTDEVDTNQVIRTLGYGIPDLERATTNTDYRTTLITSGETSINAGNCDLYQVPIPESMRQPGYEYDILVEVTLSYVAEPRRTRRNLRRYLSTWVDWKSSKLGESLSSFRSRALKEEEAEENTAAGDTLRWKLATRTDHGDIDGAKRNSGTVQKDWAIIKSFQLPENFCIAIMGHQGWSKDPDSEAKYSLAVSFEVIGREISIYDDLRIAVEDLQVELEAEVET